MRNELKQGKLLSSDRNIRETEHLERDFSTYETKLRRQINRIIVVWEYKSNASLISPYVYLAKVLRSYVQFTRMRVRICRSQWVCQLIRFVINVASYEDRVESAQCSVFNFESFINLIISYKFDNK